MHENDTLKTNAPEPTTDAPAEQEPAAARAVFDGQSEPVTPQPNEASPVLSPSPKATEGGANTTKLLLIGGGVLVLLVGLFFILFSGGGATADVLKKMPASSGGVAAIDLRVFTADPKLEELTNLGMGSLPPDGKQLLEVMPLSSLQTLGCAADASMKAAACVLTGSFDAEKAASLVAASRNLREDDIQGRKAWSLPGSEDDPEKLSLAVADTGSLVAGSKSMVAELLKSMVGEEKTIEDNERMAVALRNIDQDATIVLAGLSARKGDENETKSNPELKVRSGFSFNRPQVDFGMSIKMGSDLELTVFVKPENEKAHEDLQKAKVGLSLAKTGGPGLIDKAVAEAPAPFGELASQWAPFAKEFLESMDMSDVDGGLRLTAAATLPEGGFMQALSSAAPMFLSLMLQNKRPFEEPSGAEVVPVPGKNLK